MNEADTLFYYAANTSFASFQHPDFVPAFSTVNATQQQQNEATAFCTVNGVVHDFCVQDYLMSGGNAALAASTLSSEVGFTAIAQQLGTVLHCLAV